MENEKNVINEIKIYEFNNLRIVSDISNYNSITKLILYRFMNKIRFTLCARSTVNYYFGAIVYDKINNQIILPVKIQYHNDTDDILKLINMRISEIKNTIKNKVTYETKEMKFIVRTLKINKVDPFNMLKVVYNIDRETELVSEPLEFTLPDVEEVKIEEHVYKNGNFRHIEYIDPLMEDYGLYIGLSKPFIDMGYNYNALHLYEHMMVNASWEDLNDKDLKYFNGLTYLTGICNLYTIHSSLDSLKKYLKNYVKKHQESKNIEFWKKNVKKLLARETLRTYSETQEAKFLSFSSRSDSLFYSENKYPIEPFVKFSRDFYTILTVTPCHIKIDFDKIIDNIKVDKETVQPKLKKYKYLPLAALKDKTPIINKKDMNKEIYDKNCIIFGLDCVNVNPYDTRKKNEIINTVVSFILNSDIDKIKEFLKDKTLPNNNQIFKKIDICFNLYKQIDQYDDF